MYFRHKDHGTKRKNIKKLENQFLLNDCSYTDSVLILFLNQLIEFGTQIFDIDFTDRTSKK